MRTVLIASTLAFLSTGSVPRASQEEGTREPVALFDYEGLAKSMANLADAHPDLARLEPVGTSRDGRTIEALRITAVADPRAVPGILLVANLEGPRVFASSVALDHARRLLEDYASSEEVRGLLDSSVLWIIPRANPDAAEAHFEAPLRVVLGTGAGVDDDRDGRQGEDPPMDVDGDGRVTQMRVLDPDGPWIPDPTDPRAMVKADPSKGERGRYALYTESRDLDGDERYGEDAARDGQVNHNFPAGWEEHSARAGLFASDDPEARALCEFVLARRNLALVVVYDGMDDLVSDPKTVADDARGKMRIPPAGWLESDAGYLKEISRRYREVTENESKGSGEDEGTFGRWCYEHRGLFVLAADLWELPLGAKAEHEPEKGPDAEPHRQDAESTPRREPSEDARRLEWIDANEERWRFVPWTAYEHPELGAVEIGGFAPFARVDPPVDEGGKIADKHYRWFRSLGALPPRIRIAECTRESVGEGLFRVSAVVRNDGFLPLLSRSARRTHTTRPARLRLVLPEAARLVVGSGQVLVSDLQGSGGRHESTWLVAGPEGMEIAVSLDSDHAGREVRAAEVK